MRGFAAIAGLTLLVTTGQIHAAQISGHAFVQDDASLRIGNRTVHLFGVHVPRTSQACRTFERPIKCAPRAALALDFKIRGFVHCDKRATNPDNSVAAVCWTGRTRLSEGDDLGAYLLRKGWAAALPEAPIEYQVLEKVARNRGLGIWGFARGDSF
jgi:endonuclease YncB( thermonuclease family)